jgi:FKBP-type peptidyl-prolyl cis-trans isomerase
VSSTWLAGAGLVGLLSCAAGAPALEHVDVPVSAPAPLEVASAPAPTHDAPAPQPEAQQPEPEMHVTETGLGIVDVREGSGPEATAGVFVTVHYDGRLDDGHLFDSSRDRGLPFRFELGASRVIKGWEEGVMGMRVGGIRRLVIPPHLGYGVSGSGAVPGNAIMEFEIELLDVEPAHDDSAQP